MRLVLLADGVVGTDIARYLMVNYQEDIALIVTTEINDIHREAESRGVPVCIFVTEQNVLDRLNNGVDLGLLAWWPKILKQPLLEMPRLGFLNTHPSLLPYNRGKHYNFWALVEQAPFGVSIHRVDSGVDTGDIVAQSPIEYDWSDTGESLYNKAQAGMVDLLLNVYPILRTGEWSSKEQGEGQGSFHRASELELASQINLDSQYRARDLLNLLRARTFDGYPGCWFEEAGKRYEISIKIKEVS
jgi:methionyl-tRNA formyltransferase